MKKSTGSILLLSAFAAMVLAGCGPEKKPSSSPEAGSSDTAAPTSVDGSSAPTGASGSVTGDSTNSAADSPAASSSSSAVETDWSNKKFIGEYKGGMNNLIISADMTTSWGTAGVKCPASYTEISSGVYKIQSAASVADEDYVEIITDGTMAYVLHDKTQNDYFVMDKAALGGATIAFAETEDENTFFGGIEVTAGHWKYFACIDGAYTFNVNITIQAGTNINAGGAIFDFGTGSNKTSWKVTDPAETATSFATIEQTNFTATTYTGDHGDLVIGTDDNGLVFATLNGVAQNGATLTDNGGKLTVPVENSEVTYDMANAAGPQMVTETTVYTLSKIAGTYTQAQGTTSVSLFDEASGMSGTYSGEVDEGGHIWVWFTAPVGGRISITETQGTSCEDYYGDPEDYITVYDTSKTSLTSYSSAYGGIGYKTNDYYSGALVLSNLVVEAGHTYVVRVGGSDDNSKDWRSTGSSYEGETVSISWVFTPFTQETYTGEAGDLILEKDGSTIMSVSLNGVAMATGSFKMEGNTLTTVSNAIDMTDPNDPTYTETTTVLTLDTTAGTYTSLSTPVTTHPFHTLTASDTSYTAETGKDGNIWMIFTATEDGIIDIKETDMGVSDSFLQVFEWKAGDTLADLTNNGKNLVDSTDNNPAQLSIAVKAGSSYVIKLGAWGARNTIFGEKASDSYIGKSETMSFAFSNVIYHTFSGAEGDLVISTKNGNYIGATIGGNAVTGYAECDLANGTFTLVGQQTLDLVTDPNKPAFTSTDDIYTLDLANNTYTKATVAGCSRPAIHELDEDSTQCSGMLGEDGSMWAVITPTHYGLLSLEETVQCVNGTSHDSLVAIYEKTPTTPYASLVGWSSYSASNALDGNDNGTDLVHLDEVFLEPGHTYVIKIGAYAANSVGFGGSLASSSSYSAGYVGSAEAFEMSFEALDAYTYTNASGDPLLIIKRNGQAYKTFLGANEINGTLAGNGKSFSVPGTVGSVDTTDPSDPKAIVTSTVYYLDNDGLTYETDSESETIHLFKTIQPTDTSFTGTVASDGNLWGQFTAPEAGTITVEETVSTSSDGYISIFDTASTNNFVSGNAAKTADSGAALYGAGKITNFTVAAGHTYIIKAGNYYDRDNLIGGTGTSTYAGKTETVKFTFTGAAHDVYTGPEGEFHKLSLNGTYLGATLDGQTFNGTPNATKTVYTYKNSTLDTDTFDVTAVSKTYTLGEGTYEVETESQTTNVLADAWDAENTGTYETTANGSVIIKFTAPETATYTFSAGAVAGVDSALRIYSDALNEKGFANEYLLDKDGGNTGDGETATFACTAGTTYYLKVSYYSDRGKAITDLTATSHAGTQFTVTISK